MKLNEQQMIFMRNKRIFTIFVVLTALSACGQKGPLRLESGRSDKNSQMEANSKEQLNTHKKQSSQASDSTDKQSEDNNDRDGKGGSL